MKRDEQVKEDSVIELWVAFELLLKEPELESLSSQVFSNSDDTRLYAFLLANLDQNLTEQEQLETLQLFLDTIYVAANSVYQTLPAVDRKERLSKIISKSVQGSSFSSNFTASSQELFLNSLESGNNEGLGLGETLVGSYLVLKIGEKAIAEFNPSFAIMEILQNSH